jgi:hypothetical protein
MAPRKLDEAVTTYISKDGAKSKMARDGFYGRMTSFWGWRRANKSDQGLSPMEKKTGVRMVKVDLDNPAYRQLDSKLGQIFSNAPMSERLDKLFEAWLRDSTNGYEDLRERQKRINELMFMYYNDPFISRVVQLVADEATQLDVQDRLINVESPDPRMTDRIYALFTQWGLTQTRVHGVCFDLELLGEAFWANKVTDKGVEKIIPLQVNQILERMEFSPTKVAEEIRQRQGSVMTMVNRDAKMQMLLQQFEQISKDSEDFAEMFETKLFGYVIDNETVVPPWTITHFRAEADHSEFFPYGRPHLIAALAPFKQAASTMTLQGLARVLSFPVTLYKVKTQPGQDEGQVWDHINRVREEYDNIGVNPQAGQTEAYSVNTKIWIPDGLMDVDVKESKADIDFVADLEMYIDRIAIASGVPKGYLVQEWGGFGVSAISLTEQYKPFARHVYTIQAAFLEGLGDLVRLHFAITNEFEYTTPFTLGMRFPAEEMSDEKRQARTSTLELASAVMDLIGTAMGLEEGEPLPPDVVKDIMAKYTFLDPTDVLQWTKKVGDQVLVNKANGGGDDEESGEGGLDLGGGGMGGGGDDLGGDIDLDGGEGGPDEAADVGAPSDAVESRMPSARPAGQLLRELAFSRKQALARIQEERFVELRGRYREIKRELYFEVLTSQRIDEFTRKGRHIKLMEGVGHHSNEWTYSTLRAYAEYKKTGKNSMSPMKTLRETMEDMHLSDTAFARDDRVEFKRIKETLDDPTFDHSDDGIGAELIDEDLPINDVNPESD